MNVLKCRTLGATAYKPCCLVYALGLFVGCVPLWYAHLNVTQGNTCMDTASRRPRHYSVFASPRYRGCPCGTSRICDVLQRESQPMA